MSDESSVARCSCKIGRAVEKYELTELDAEILSRRDEEASLRDLADFVNVRILDVSISKTNADVAGDTRSVYSALTDSQVPTQRRVNVEDRLARLNLDVEEIQRDFVSYQTVRTHLQDCLGVDTSRGGVTTVDEGREVIEWARGRDRTVIDRTLDRLRRTEALDIGDFGVTVSVTVTCEECGTSYRVDEFLEEGGCSCRSGVT